MDFLRNAWYVAAWSSEVTRQLFSRTIIGDPVLLYRSEAGAAIAISDRCAHRFAPLHMGKLIGDVVECGYHGLRYDCRGVCVSNPHGDGKIPKAAHIKSYPAVEKHGLIWLWMGSADKADESTIPDFSCLVDSERFATVGGTISMAANYELITDNLMDLTHVEYLHEGILGSDAIKRGVQEVIEDGETLHSNRWCPDGLAPPAWDAMFGNFGKPVDHWLNMRWNAPASMLLDVGITPAGQSRDQGIWVYGTDILTPESESKTHYFWGVSRAYDLDNPAAGEAWEAAIHAAFAGQDKPMVEAQQKMIGSRDFWSLKPVLLATDSGAVRARRRLAEMMQAEAKGGRDAIVGAPG